MATRKMSRPLRSIDWVRGNTVGAGSFGIVNLAMNRSTGELFVVKSAPSCSPGFQSLKNEADILVNLHSPYIVRCLGHELAGKQCGGQEFNLFMEYMAGGSLSEIVHKFGGSLDESVIRSYTREILRGVQYLHKNNILHCDLKCKNVLLGSSGNVKLADLGCAKRLTSLGTMIPPSQALCGTPLWMAPEALKNEELGLPADIWSLGCTVIEMATGRPPWADVAVSNPMAAVYKITCSEDTPAFPTSFSKEGIDFLSKCLKRDPRKRWTCEELLNHPFVSEQIYCSSEASHSPTSVLDLGFRGGNWSAVVEEPADTPTEIATTLRRIPFSTSCCQEERAEWKNNQEFDVQGTGGWLEVRSA